MFDWKSPPHRRENHGACALPEFRPHYIPQHNRDIVAIAGLSSANPIRTKEWHFQPVCLTRSRAKRPQVLVEARKETDGTRGGLEPATLEFDRACPGRRRHLRCIGRVVMSDARLANM